VTAGPAKLNLGLAVTGRRPDGYHELRSIFLRIGLRDELLAQTDPNATSDELTIEGDPDCRVEGNLVLRAVALARDAIAPDAPRLSLRLIKRIPMGAGLGGGSSDAAAALRLCADAWSLDAAYLGRFRRIAEKLGADVPFFLDASSTALVSGVGERWEPLDGVPRGIGVLLVVPAASISTADAFRAFDDGARPSEPSTDLIDTLAGELRARTSATDFADRAGRLRDANDLWPAAASLAPELPGLRDRLERALDRPFLLSGSGSTVFALYPSIEEADDALARLRADQPKIVTEARLVTAVPLDT
jgi:4-diphosphocytidyl-2-C-methyl-D-erythritol kinase